MRNWFGARGSGVLVVLLSALVAACGGGGGGGGGTDGGGGSAPVTSGLLPSEPALGATLYADAAALRPLRDQAVLNFRGVDTTNFRSTAYVNTVRQRAQGGGVVEEQSNSLNGGPDTGEPLVLQAGAITQRQPLQFVDGGPVETLNVIELRSPVRHNDRWVIYDKRIDNSGVDFDGDRVNDALDVAIWGQVIGEETIDLPNRSQVRAVRVDTTLRLRVRYSVSKQVSEVSEVVGSNWYASGLGLVRSRLESPPDNPGEPRPVQLETLVDWDGGTEGLGTTAVAAQVTPAATGLGGAALGYPDDAVAFDNHAVVLTGVPGQLPGYGFVLSRLDTRGQVTASTVYRYDSFAGVRNAFRPRLLRVGDALRVLWVDDAGIQMLSTDATGQQLTAAAPVLLAAGPLYDDADRQYFQAAATADTVWLSWMNYPAYVDGQNLSTLRLRRFSPAGVPQAAAVELEAAINPLAVNNVQAAVSGGRAVWSWGTTIAFETKRWRYVVDSSAGLVAQRTLPTLAANAPCADLLRPHALAAGTLFTCYRYPDANGLLRLDDSYAALTGSDGLPRVDALLPTAWQQNQGQIQFGPDTDRMLFAARQYSRYWPEDNLESGFWQVGELAAVGGQFAAANVRVLGRIPTGSTVPAWYLPLGNRILVVGSTCGCEGAKLQTMLVWRSS